MTLKRLQREIKWLEARVAHLEATIAKLESRPEFEREEPEPAEAVDQLQISLHEAYARKLGLAGGLPFTPAYELQISQTESELSPFEVSVLKALCDVAREAKSASITVSVDDLTGPKAVSRAIVKLREVGAIE